MSDLVEFLRARLDEDEDQARSCAGPHWCGCRHVNFVMTAGDCDCGYPARVLAEVEAKRKIIERHRVRDDAPACTECGGFEARTHRAVGIIHHGYVIPWPCPTLRMLAQVYADHPDYREEWR